MVRVRRRTPAEFSQSPCAHCPCRCFTERVKPQGALKRGGKFLLYHIADDFRRSFVSRYRFSHKPIRGKIVNGYGTGGFAPLCEKTCSVGTGDRRIFCVIFVSVIRFFVSHSCPSPPLNQPSYLAVSKALEPKVRRMSASFTPCLNAAGLNSMSTSTFIL